ncbi:H-NS family nucleoid-associated regulatory protein [Variovorax sp. LT1P1]|uniref:H-NS family nucleoid-associated regulatory protein n=1 Tax=Variovorax sp. LT1P1 TaxID=3443730 RepID=UPI003F466B57
MAKKLIDDLIAQRDALDAKIREAQSGRANALKTISGLVASFGLKPEDIFPGSPASQPSAGSTPPARTRKSSAAATSRASAPAPNISVSDAHAKTGRKRKTTTRPLPPDGKMPNAKVPMKYKDPNSQLAWSGRGKRPKWIQGQDLSHFLIKK